MCNQLLILCRHIKFLGQNCIPAFQILRKSGSPSSPGLLNGSWPAIKTGGEGAGVVVDRSEGKFYTFLGSINDILLSNWSENFLLKSQRDWKIKKKPEPPLIIMLYQQNNFVIPHFLSFMMLPGTFYIFWLMRRYPGEDIPFHSV